MSRPKTGIMKFCQTCPKSFYCKPIRKDSLFCSVKCYKQSTNWGGFKKGHKVNEGTRVKTKDIKDVARYYVKNAVRDGRLSKSDKCEHCGVNDARLEGHHYLGYAWENWLKVVWLCGNCHRKEDGFEISSIHRLSSRKFA